VSYSQDRNYTKPGTVGKKPSREMGSYKTRSYGKEVKEISGKKPGHGALLWIKVNYIESTSYRICFR